MGINPNQAGEMLKGIQEAVASGDSQRAAELFGDLITLAEKSGEIDQATSRKLRLDLVATMIQAIPQETREKVTLSLPQDVLKALRLAGAEAGKEMSEIVSAALRQELKKYHHASQALRKTT